MVSKVSWSPVDVCHSIVLSGFNGLTQKYVKGKSITNESSRVPRFCEMVHIFFYLSYTVVKRRLWWIRAYFLLNNMGNKTCWCLNYSCWGLNPMFHRVWCLNPCEILPAQKKSLTNQLSSLVHFTSFYRFTKKSTARRTTPPANV